MYIAYMHTYICTYIRTYIHTYIHTYIYTYIYTCIHTYMHTHIHTYIYTYICTCIHTFICVQSKENNQVHVMKVYGRLVVYVHTFLSVACDGQLQKIFALPR